MTAEERLELAIRTFTELRDIYTRQCERYSEQGQSSDATFCMQQSITWNDALMMLTKETVLRDAARICGLEVSE